MRHWLFVLNFHFSSLLNWRQTLVNSRTYVFGVLISFSFLFLRTLLRQRIFTRTRVSLPVCGSASCFPDHVLVVCSPGWCLMPGLQPSECCSRGPWGCLFVLSFIMPFFNCHCGKTGMCHCLLLTAGVRKPNYLGSQCLVVVVRWALCVCVCVVLLSSCPRPHWQRWQGMVTVALVTVRRRKKQTGL